MVKFLQHDFTVLSISAISVTAAVNLDRYAKHSQVYQPPIVVTPNPPVMVTFPPKDINGQSLVPGTELVSMGKGTCCAAFLDRAYRMAYDPRSKDILFLIADLKQKPQKVAYGRFVLVGDPVPGPGFYVKADDSRYILQDFPKWWQDAK